MQLRNKSNRETIVQLIVLLLMVFLLVKIQQLNIRQNTKRRAQQLVAARLLIGKVTEIRLIASPWLPQQQSVAFELSCPLVQRNKNTHLYMPTKLPVNPTNIAPKIKAAICIKILYRNFVVFKEEYSLNTKYNKTPFIDVLISAGIYLLLKKDESYINSLNRISTAIPRNESKT
jgi:hypothetical protein